MPHTVAFLLVPNFQLLDMSGPAAVFQIAGAEAPTATGPAYTVQVVSEHGGLVRSTSGIEIQTRPWRGLRADTLIVAGGEGARETAVTPGMRRYLHAQRQAGKRLASVCTGAFVLAGAGLLDGLRATTHWRRAAMLARNHPGVRVDADKIHVRDGGLWTSAGITAGIDLALAMVEADLGADVAAATAREMVVYHRRSGGQSQFSALQDLAPDSERMRAVLEHIRANLGAALTVEQLAEVACVSPRQFLRSFKAETGETPAKAVERIRAEAARGQIAAGGSSIESIARRVGFTDSERMRRAFLRVYGQPPQALRRAARSQASTG
ncbi:GlxA family transcriptional regulator [Achromobacter sp. UMC71]|uniref:GlxA family transcriptional regulator n=1 Tax=Achromobacter sp. UMC71 TaxID=1862320 RepID=UPI0015FF093B|nr:GlxA family transcriptional regulator [Achromobacter sp. UMC71]MBB1626717.1 AraC family transcriptional regulator [Achromobacter sp. UMC71]